jgi:hypothetical protein
MSNLQGKLPFVGAIYRQRGGVVKITCRSEKGHVILVSAENFYEKFKRMKEGTPFTVEEGWNE